MQTTISDSKRKKDLFDDYVHRLTSAIIEIVKASLKASPEEVAFGHPCSTLIARAATVGAKEVAIRILSRTSEYPLNGAGLKLYTRVHDEDRDMFQIRVGGDQFKNYPQTGPIIKEILERYGLS